MNRRENLVAPSGDGASGTPRRFRCWLRRALLPERGCCRCHSYATYHTTMYSSSHGAIPLCERCWAELTPTQRLPWYRQLWDKWNRGGFWIQHADGTWHDWPRPVSWPVLEAAVLGEGSGTPEAAKPLTPAVVSDFKRNSPGGGTDG